MTTDPFNTYLDAEVSKKTSDEVLKSASQKMKPRLSNLVFKYSLLFFSSLLFSLIICPQRGVGILRNSYPFFHHLLHQSEVLCGLYCGFMFFLTTHVLSFFLLTHFERLLIVRKISYIPALFISLFFGLSMTSFYSSLDLSALYFLSWATIAALSYFSLNFYYTKSYPEAS